jgi:Protein of unknown function (DUF1552)
LINDGCLEALSYGMARSYRVARRAFLAGVGGAFGLKVLLRNLEAAAEGAAAPARFVMAHWPQGTLRYRFQPAGSGSTYTTSPIVQPFEDAGLRGDMTVFWGFSDSHLRCPGGGGREAGTVFTTTGCSAPGTRANGGETDDAVAGGPSFDQLLLKRAPGLASDQGYVNLICDRRVDSFETSSQCLSYGYDTRPVTSNQSGSTIYENLPLMPLWQPERAYAQLFAGFMAGGATPENQEAALLALKLRKSVLDHALRELAQLRGLAPSSERSKIELHEQAIRELEQRLQDVGQPGGCTPGTAPRADLSGKSGNTSSFGTLLEDDTATHLAVAEAHLAVLTAALSCDLVRVATFQFAPGTNHVVFGGLWPGAPTRLATQYQTSRMSPFLGTGLFSDPSSLSESDRAAYDFLVNVQVWYNQRLAAWLKQLKSTPDGFGGTLLDTTVVPFVTEVAAANSQRSPKPAFLFGGGKLGLKHGTYQAFSQVRPQVDLFLTCAQALMRTADPLAALAGERFLEFNPAAAPIADLWSPV